MINERRSDCKKGKNISEYLHSTHTNSHVEVSFLDKLSNYNNFIIFTYLHAHSLTSFSYYIL